MHLKDVLIPAGDRAMPAKLAVDGDARSPGILLLPDAAGLRPSIFDTARRLAGAGFAVLAPDPYYRLDEPPLDIADVFAHGADWRRMDAMRQTLTHAHLAADIQFALRYIGEHDAFDATRLACVGLSFGGRYALAAAAAPGHPFKVVVTVHAGALATGEDDSPHLLAPRMGGHVVVIAAEEDKQFPPEQCDVLRAALSGAGVSHQIDIVQGSTHGFTTPESRAYDTASASAMWSNVISVLSERLGPRAAYA